MRRIGKVVRTVENSYVNAKDGKQESREHWRHNLLCKIQGATLEFNSTGTECAVLGGDAPGVTTGFGTIRVYGALLPSSTTASLSTGTRILATWVSGRWQLTGTPCTV